MVNKFSDKKSAGSSVNTQTEPVQKTYADK